MQLPSRVPLLLVHLLLLLLTACGARSLNKKTARDVILSLDESSLEKEGIYIESINQTGAKDAIADVTLEAAFRLERVEGKWVVREVRLGKGGWHKLEHVLTALVGAKTEETRALLQQVGSALERYVEVNGALPEFKDYVALSDLLSPQFMPRLIREDAWQRPLAAERGGDNIVRLISAGPDGKFGTTDDIELSKTLPRR